MDQRRARCASCRIGARASKNRDKKAHHDSKRGAQLPRRSGEMKSDYRPPNLVFDFAEKCAEPRYQPKTDDLPRLAMASPPTKLLLDVREVGEALGCGKTYVYQLIARDELRAVKLGRRTKIPAACLAEFVYRKIESARLADADC